MEARTRARDAGMAILLFVVALATFILLPPFLKADFAPYPALGWGDILDLATPLVVIPLAWLLLAAAAPGRVSRGAAIAFMVLAAAWVEGQGLHLGANAINNLAGDVGGIEDSVADLTHFLDEVLSHYLWHAALIGLTVLIGARALRGAPTGGVEGARVLSVTAAAVFGFTFFAMIVEGGTGPIGVPGAAMLALGGLWQARNGFGRRPAADAFALGYALASLLFVAWAAMNGWQLVQFSEAGII